MLSIPDWTSHFTAPYGLLMLTSYMLSILGRIGYFTVPSGLLSGLLQRLIENALKKALLIIPLPGSRLSSI